MTRSGNRDLTPEELSALLRGELAPTLPIESWRMMTLHCQIDAISPSDRHPDLVKLQVSLPPVEPPAPPAQLCRRCRGIVPGHTGRNQSGDRIIWNDKPDRATPHGYVRRNCPTCGPTVLEEHPHQQGILRCRNCKEHLGHGHDR
ncbi:hypothetical protein [Streptomyces sp. NPDC046976]|uniref:hypothetical protein n=1 Tax=Streptomyces sp. NPDC046976 TaxID=3155258 RepID=UPI0033F749A5